MTSFNCPCFFFKTSIQITCPFSSPLPFFTTSSAVPYRDKLDNLIRRLSSAIEQHDREVHRLECQEKLERINMRLVWSSPATISPDVSCSNSFGVFKPPKKSHLHYTAPPLFSRRCFYRQSTEIS